MRLLQLAATVLALGSSVQGAPAHEIAPRQASVKYCDPVSTICYSEWISPERIAFRTAIPDNATATADFDVLVQLQAPKSVGWAGIAWGGTMVNNPLTVAWANAATVVVSSRRATYDSSCHKHIKQQADTRTEQEPTHSHGLAPLIRFSAAPLPIAPTGLSTSLPRASRTWGHPDSTPPARLLALLMPSPTRVRQAHLTQPAALESTTRVESSRTTSLWARLATFVLR